MLGPVLTMLMLLSSARRIPVFQGSSRMTPLLQETKALLKIIPSRDDLDVSPESFSAITDIIIAGKQSPSGSQPFKAANAVAQELATATTSEAGFKDNIAIDAMLLLNKYAALPELATCVSGGFRVFLLLWIMLAMSVCQ